MTEISRSALLPYPAEKMYALINDIAAYPQYMEGCVATELLSEGFDEQGAKYIQARLDLSKAGLRHSLTTRNRLQAPYRVEMTLVDGPFDSFSGLWSVQELSDSACKVSLVLNFSLSNKVLSAATKLLFNPMADNLVDALVKRAHHLYK
jgi:ribosome-associated toxin RatA of RatAB toxin-antitoxin module